jgi:hypothetical protein
MPAICLLKNITGIPCPSCGVTRSVISLLNGDLSSAVSVNPLGVLLFIMIVLTPLWIVYDLAGNKSTLLLFYGHTEAFFKQKTAAIAGILLVTANWIWNIYKGL